MEIMNPRASVIELTSLCPFDRFPDGRSCVSDELLGRMKMVTTEEAWSTMRKHGYNFQFEGSWFCTHPDRILVGRAVTAMMMPKRPDLHELIEEKGKKEGRTGDMNSWVIDILKPGDVLVVDLFGKIKDGTFVGDNLSTAIQAHKASAVINGGIRDFQGVSKLEEVVIFCRGLHPSAIADTTLVGINIPIRIGEVTVLPGDVVLGTPTGVAFIPPHLVQETVERSENTRMRDEFTKERLREGHYTPGEIDKNWSLEIENDFQNWLKTQRE